MEEKNVARVGIFDSGIGGLTVLRECVRLSPKAVFYYLGDNFRAPYGNRPKEEILRFTEEAMKTFCEVGVNAVVLACNTATAVCAETLRAEYSFPVLGMEPAVKPAARCCKNVLVLSTRQTAQSGRLKNLTERFPQCRFTLCAVPDLAYLIERQVLCGEDFILEELLPRGNYDGVVLGCTHYIFIKEKIEKFYGVRVYDGNFGTAAHLAEILRAEKPPLLGTDYHQQPPPKLKQMYGKLNNMTDIDIYFIGKAGELNEKAYFTNVCFKNN